VIDAPPAVVEEFADADFEFIEPAETERAAALIDSPPMEIVSVEIQNGGPTRIMYEEGITSAVVDGVTKYYTDRHAISFTDPRRINVSVVFDDFNGVNDADFLSNIEWTLGEKPLSQWYGGDNLNTTSNRLSSLKKVNSLTFRTESTGSTRQ